MRVLGVDLATNTGHAFDGESVCPPITGTYRLVSGGENRGLSLHEYSKWLWHLVGTAKIEFIAFEAPIFGGAPSHAEKLMLLIGLAAVTEMVAASRGIRSKAANMQTVRKHFVGTGRPQNPKKVVAERCRLLGWVCADDNQSDACAVWAWAKANYDPSFRLEQAKPLFGRPPEVSA